VENKRFVHVGLASDHAGYKLKEVLINWLRDEGYEIRDFGCPSVEPCDYPDYAHPLARAVSGGQCHVGISLCGTGNGISMVVNKYPSIRGAICWNGEISSLARRHNDANICSLPARYMVPSEAIQIVKTFLETDFEAGRHQRRIGKIPVMH